MPYLWQEERRRVQNSNIHKAQLTQHAIYKPCLKKERQVHCVRGLQYVVIIHFLCFLFMKIMNKISFLTKYAIFEKSHWHQSLKQI